MRARCRRRLLFWEVLFAVLRGNDVGYVLDWQELEPADEIGHGHLAANAAVSVGAGTWPTIDHFCADEVKHPTLS
jgi:hypothetical protein